MPPAQCPECGRFLARAFVLGLATQPADCPKCGTTLSAAHFPEVLGQAASPDAAAEEPAAAAELRADAPPDPDMSVRPPDLDPGAVRGPGSDPLAGWDRGPATDVPGTPGQPPPDAMILGGTGAAGALLGALLSRRRVRGGIVGLLLGVVAAAVARQVWRLPD